MRGKAPGEMLVIDQMEKDRWKTDIQEPAFPAKISLVQGASEICADE